MASIFKRGADKKNRKKPWLIQYFDHEGKKRTKTGFTDIELTRQLASKIEHEAKLLKAGLATVDRPAKAEQPIEECLAKFRQHISRSDNTEKHVRQTCTRVNSVILAAEINTPKDIEFDESRIGATRAKGRQGL